MPAIWEDVVLERCDALIVAKSVEANSSLLRLATRAGFGRSILLPQAAADGASSITFFLLHYQLADTAMQNVLSFIRKQDELKTRFAPVIVIADDCPFEQVLRYVTFGFDDVISLPERADIIRDRLEGQLRTEQVYFETPSYLGPDRRRFEAESTADGRRAEYGAAHERLVFTRDTTTGIKILRRHLADSSTPGSNFDPARARRA